MSGNGIPPPFGEGDAGPGGSEPSRTVWHEPHPLLVVATFAPGEPSQADISGLLERLDGLHARGRPFLLVLDCRRVDHPISTLQRRMIANRAPNAAARVRRARVRMGDLIVTSSPLVRGTFAAIGWMTVFNVPKLAVATMADGIPFVEERCAAFGLSLPADARAFLTSG